MLINFACLYGYFIIYSLNIKTFLFFFECFSHVYLLLHFLDSLYRQQVILFLVKNQLKI